MHIVNIFFTENYGAAENETYLVPRFYFFFYGNIILIIPNLFCFFRVTKAIVLFIILYSERSQGAILFVQYRLLCLFFFSGAVKQLKTLRTSLQYLCIQIEK